MVILGVCALARGVSMEAIDGLPSGKVIILNGKWELNTGEGSDYMEYRFCIPESADGSLLLCMKTYLTEFQVLLDDEPLYSFSDVYSMQGRSQHMVRIPWNSQGRQIIVQVAQDSYASAKGQDQIGNAYLGEVHGVALQLLRDNLYALIFAIFALLLGMGSVIVGGWLRENIMAEMQHCLISFGLFVLITGIWVLTDSELLLFVTNKVAAVSLISFTSFMIMPVFLLEFINQILGGNRVILVLR